VEKVGKVVLAPVVKGSWEVWEKGEKKVIAKK
jgi:hypothetical protein